MMIFEEKRKTPVEIIEEYIEEIKHGLEEIKEIETQLFGSSNKTGYRSIDREEVRELNRIIQILETTVVPNLTKINDFQEDFIRIEAEKDDLYYSNGHGAIWAAPSTLLGRYIEPYLDACYKLKEERQKVSFRPNWITSETESRVKKLERNFKKRYKGKVNNTSFFTEKDMRNVAKDLSSHETQIALKTFKRKYGDNAIPDLKEELTDEDQHDDHLEKRFTEMLRLCGLISFHLGSENTARSDVDTIAYSGASDFCMVIEFTTGKLKESKIAQLTKHLEWFEDNFDTKIIPVAVFNRYEDLEALSISETEAVRKCGENKISLWTSQNIRELSKKVASGEINPTYVKRNAIKSIPDEDH